MSSNCPTTWPKQAKTSDFVSLKRAHRRTLFERLWVFPSLFTDCLQSAFHRIFFCLLKFFLVFICFTFVKSDRSWFLGAIGMTQFWTQSRMNFLRLIWTENKFRISFLRTFTNFPRNENQSCLFLLFISIKTTILIVEKSWKSWKFVRYEIRN